MDKVPIDLDNLETIYAWVRKNKECVANMDLPMKAVEFVFVEQKSDYRKRIKFVVSGCEIDASLFANYEKIADAKVKLDYENKRFGFSKYKSKIISESDFSEFICLYFAVMSLMVYGNDAGHTYYERTEEGISKDRKHSDKRKKQAKKDSKTYILKCGNGSVNIVRQGSHASPTGRFNVRGHYRHYKNGKTIWISEYEKGTDKKKKSKSYVFAKNN